MLAKTHSFGISGLDAYPVTIEVDVSRGLPYTIIVGLPDNAVKESKERVRSAIKNSGHQFPGGRLTVNLSPADTKKEGPCLDLAMAVGVLAATQQMDSTHLADFALLGELSLDGRVQPVSGILSMALFASKTSLKGIIVPAANALEAAVIDQINVYPVMTLNEVVHFLTTPQTIAPYKILRGKIFSPPSAAVADFSEVKGQSHVKRGLEIAAAGGHNVLLVGTQYNRWNLRWWRPCQTILNHLMGTTTRAGSTNSGELLVLNTYLRRDSQTFNQLGGLSKK